MRAPTPLTQPEKIAGRAFKAAAQAGLDQLATELCPDYAPPYLLAILRHPCPARGGVSTGLTLKEVYVLSPEQDTIPAGRFGFFYKRGRCTSCGQLALSPVGKFVDAHTRPPVQGRVSR